MPDEFVAAIDQGTTGTRCLIVDRLTRVVGDAYRTHEQYYPRPGWVEHDPMEIWANTRAVVTDALTSAGIEPRRLAGIGIANQRETTVVWDPTSGEPVGRAIVWQDRRTTDRVEELIADGWDEYIRETTGLAVDAYFSATKLEWLLEHLPRGYEPDGVAFGTIDAWLIHQLTGRHATDVTNASRTMLYDINRLAWDDTLLEEFGILEGVLPAVHASCDPDAYGRTDKGVFGAAVPVAGVLGDQQAALFGQACYEPGDAKNTYGTGSFLLLHTGDEPVESEHGLLTTVAYQRAGEPAQYALEGSIFNTGAAIEWLVDLGLIESAAASADLAGGVESSQDVYFVPAFTGLGAPHWDGRARGTIIGLTRGTEPAHVVRAALESTAYQTRDVVEAMTRDSGLSLDQLRVDGGAVSNDVLCQYQADILQARVVRPAVSETTALGAAYAAGLAVGYWDSYAEVHDRWRADREFDPSLDPATAADRYARWQEAVDRAKRWATD